MALGWSSLNVKSPLVFWRLPHFEDYQPLFLKMRSHSSPDYPEPFHVTSHPPWWCPKTIKWRPLFRRHFAGKPASRNVVRLHKLQLQSVSSSLNLSIYTVFHQSFKRWLFLCVSVAQFGGQFTNLVKFWVTGPLNSTFDVDTARKIATFITVF